MLLIFLKKVSSLLQNPVEEYIEAENIQTGKQVQNPNEILQHASELIDQLTSILTEQQGQVIQDFFASLAGMLSQFQNNNLTDLQNIYQQRFSTA